MNPNSFTNIFCFVANFLDFVKKIHQIFFGKTSKVVKFDIRRRLKFTNTYMTVGLFMILCSSESISLMVRISIRFSGHDWRLRWQ